MQNQLVYRNYYNDIIMNDMCSVIQIIIKIITSLDAKLEHQWNRIG